MRINIFKEFFSLSGSRFLNILIGMISSMILVRLYSISEYGVYSQCLIIANIITTVLSLSISNSANYFISRSKDSEEEKNIVSYLLTISIIQCLMAILITILLSKSLANYFNNSSLKLGIIITSILPAYNILRGFYEVSMICIKNTKQVILSQIILSLIYLFITIIFILSKHSIYLYMFFIMVINTIMIGYMIYIIIKKFTLIKVFKIPNRNFIRSMFEYSIPIWLGNIVGILNVQIDKLFIAKKVDIEALAIYTNMSKELPLSVISASIIVIITPYMIRYYKNRRLDKMIIMWRDSIEITWIILCISVVFLLFMTSETITILYSKLYLDGIDVFRIYTVLLLFRVTYFGLILNVSNKTKYIAYYTLITFIMNILLNGFLYNLIGYNGPALATLISNFIIGTLQLIHASKILECRIVDIIPIKEMIISLIKCIIIGLIISVINYFIIGLKINLIIRVILLGFIYTIVCGALFIKRIKRLKNRMLINE